MRPTDEWLSGSWNKSELNLLMSCIYNSQQLVTGAVRAQLSYALLDLRVLHDQNT